MKRAKFKFKFAYRKRLKVDKKFCSKLDSFFWTFRFHSFFGNDTERPKRSYTLYGWFSCHTDRAGRYQYKKSANFLLDVRWLITRASDVEPSTYKRSVSSFSFSVFRLLHCFFHSMRALIGAYGFFCRYKQNENVIEIFLHDFLIFPLWSSSRCRSRQKI